MVMQFYKPSILAEKLSQTEKNLDVLIPNKLRLFKLVTEMEKETLMK